MIHYKSGSKSSRLRLRNFGVRFGTRIRLRLRGVWIVCRVNSRKRQMCIRRSQRHPHNLHKNNLKACLWSTTSHRLKRTLK